MIYSRLLLKILILPTELAFETALNKLNVIQKLAEGPVSTVYR